MTLTRYLLDVRVRALAVCAVLVLALTACSAPGATFVDEDNTYDFDAVSQLQVSVERPASAGDPVAESSVQRRDALIRFRSHGATGSAFAEFITATLPDTGRSVPYYGEAATVEGTDAWILLELWGPEGGALENVRVWVFDRTDGAVLFSSSN